MSGSCINTAESSSDCSMAEKMEHMQKEDQYTFKSRENMTRLEVKEKILAFHMKYTEIFLMGF